MKKYFILIISVVLILSIVGCGKLETNINNEEQVVGIVDWVLTPTEITVEVGEEFKINYSPIQEQRPIWNHQHKSDGIIEYVGADWNPNKGFSYIDEDGVATFKATSVGITTIGEMYGDSNVCTVTVVETAKQEKPVVIENGTKSSSNIELVLDKPLPQEVHWIDNERGTKYSSCTIREANIDISSNNIAIDLICEKTYDFKSTSRMNCTATWKIYDSSNIIVSSGIITKNNINLNEKFSYTIYVSNIRKEGKYRLVFDNVTI